MVLSFNWYKYSVVIGFLKKKVKAAVAPDEHWPGTSWPVQSEGREFEYREAGRSGSRWASEQETEKYEGAEVENKRTEKYGVEEADHQGAERHGGGEVEGQGTGNFGSRKVDDQRAKKYGRWEVNDLGTERYEGAEVEDKRTEKYGVEEVDDHKIKIEYAETGRLRWKRTEDSGVKKLFEKNAAGVKLERPFGKWGEEVNSERLSTTWVKGAMAAEKRAINEDLFQLARVVKIELSISIRGCAIKNPDKQELLLSLRNLLKPYTALAVRQAHAFRVAINNAIELEVRKYCSIHLSGQDLLKLWQGPG